MGEVYEAYDTSKDRVVALKLLPEELAKDPAYQERFRRESQAAARLAEPHIIPIHDWGEIDGVLYIDMRLVRGEDLRSLLDRLGPLPPLRVMGIIEQVAAALDAAHYSGLVHRDVKPANILVTDADFAYLADFGIARAEGDSTITMTGTAIGSYAYMAPERFDAGPVSGRADIYSLGCVLHECLTGDKPFPTQNMSGLVRAHLSEPPPLTSMLRAGIPPQLDGVVAKALAKDPNARFFTAGEFARAARMALAGGQAAPPPGMPPRPGRTVPPGPPVGAPTTVMSPAQQPFGPPTTVLPGGTPAAPPSNEPTARNSDPTVRQPNPQLVTPTGSIPAYITGAFPVAEEPSGDLPVIRPSDPTRVRVSDFHYTPLPADAQERAVWGHAQAQQQDFPYAPAPDDSLYPTSEHAVVYDDPPRSRQRRRKSVALPVAIGVLVIAAAAIAGAVGWQVLDRSGNETPITTAAQGVPGTTTSRSQSANPTVTTTAPTTVQLPAGSTPCPQVYAALGGFANSAIGNSGTSCPFAEEVRRAYADATSGRPGSEVSVVAVSPVTGRSYTMNCTAAGKLVTCAGGDKAVVYVY
ncbi:protein kinase [Nocardia sp. ET3-3]|uniref:non-specific serine/threonine protein kinase n=2 Tax=Nocardia terrae TaxID=2675851 RepID=A0A7K1UQK0_9NOCA|nr:protein kinase [Nocardia terrae]